VNFKEEIPMSSVNQRSGWLYRCALMCLLAMAFVVGGKAQMATAVLQGTVVDPSGAAVPNAKIVVRNESTGIQWTTQSNNAGNYLVAGLPAGEYRVEVTRTGFQTYVATGLKLDVGTTTVRNLQLKVGQVSQQVVVAAGAPVLQTGSISVGQVINQNTVQNIPLNGRHFVDLTLLIPGSVTPPANGFLTFPLRGQGSFGANTGGGREDTVNWMVNGINLSDEVQNQITFQPSINTVSEFKVDNSTFSAEYGRNSGAIVDIGTRSGTNDYHGQVYEYLRNSAMDARNFFNPVTVPQSPFIRNQFGASGGGPIVKNKAFFYVSYEGLRQRQGLTINQPVLSSTERAQAQANGDATIQKLLPLIPAANSGTNIFLGSVSAPVDIDQGTADLMFNLGQNDHLHGYYALQHDLRQEPTLQGDNIPGFGDTRTGHRQIMTIDETHIFSPTLINEARLGYNRIYITFVPFFQANPVDYGIDSGITTPIGLPFISIQSIGLNFAGPNGFPQGRGDTTVVFSDTVRWLKGKHQLSIGGDVRRFYNNNFGENVGSFTFPDVTSFINDQGNRFTGQVGNGASRILQAAWGLFIQDGYKMKPNFTWELGLRYDWNSTPSEAMGRFVVFDPATATLGQTSQPYHTNNKNFQPRLGFVWSPGKSGKTAIRAAYAILTDQPVTNAVTGLTINPPFNTPIVFNGAVSLTNAFTVAQTGNAAGLAPATMNYAFDNSYIQSYNLNIQQELTSTLGLMVGYFGSKGTHLRYSSNINQPIIQADGSLVRPYSEISPSSPIDPGKAVGNITQVNSGGNSSYNALWVSLNKHFSHGFQFNTSYTWSKSIDYNSISSSGVTLQNSYDAANNRGLSDFNTPNRFVFNGIYDLPFKGNRLVNGWQISTIIQAQSGNPLTVFVPVSSVTGNFTLRPDIIGKVQTIGDPSQWFSTGVCNPLNGPCAASDVFAIPVQMVNGKAVYHYGDLGRNSLRGPAFADMDFGLQKTTKINERFGTEFRADIFDLFNHPNFGNPGLFAGTSTFGKIFGTRFPTGDFGSSRQIQLSLKLTF
jgi:hypothetical protein